MAKIEVEESEVIELYLLMEKLNDFFHQPSNYETQQSIENFANSTYPDISKAYYKTTWSWLPQGLKNKIEVTTHPPNKDKKTLDKFLSKKITFS